MNEEHRVTKWLPKINQKWLESECKRIQKKTKDKCMIESYEDKRENLRMALFRIPRV